MDRVRPLNDIFKNSMERSFVTPLSNAGMFEESVVGKR